MRQCLDEDDLRQQHARRRRGGEGREVHPPDVRDAEFWVRMSVGGVRVADGELRRTRPARRNVRVLAVRAVIVRDGNLVQVRPPMGDRSRWGSGDRRDREEDPEEADPGRGTHQPNKAARGPSRQSTGQCFANTLVAPDAVNAITSYRS
jgi:hypothetical protein